MDTGNGEIAGSCDNRRKRKNPAPEKLQVSEETGLEMEAETVEEDLPLPTLTLHDIYSVGDDDENCADFPYSITPSNQQQDRDDSHSDSSDSDISASPDAPAVAISNGVSSQATATPGPVVKKRRGRPPGSKNKDPGTSPKKRGRPSNKDKAKGTTSAGRGRGRPKSATPGSHGHIIVKLFDPIDPTKKDSPRPKPRVQVLPLLIPGSKKKRRPGRPKADPSKDSLPKRPRGRPRKHPKVDEILKKSSSFELEVLKLKEMVNQKDAVISRLKEVLHDLGHPIPQDIQDLEEEASTPKRFVFVNTDGSLRDPEADAAMESTDQPLPATTEQSTPSLDLVPMDTSSSSSSSSSDSDISDEEASLSPASHPDFSMSDKPQSEFAASLPTADEIGQSAQEMVRIESC